MNFKFILLIVFVTNLSIAQEVKQLKLRIDSLVKLDNNLEKQNGELALLLAKESLPLEVKSYLYHSNARSLFVKGEVDSAIYHIKKAIELRKIHEPYELKKSIYNLSVYYKNKGLFDKSIEELKKIVLLPKNDRLRMKAYSQLALMYKLVGDFEKSIQYFEKSTQYFIKTKDYNSLFRNYMRISSVYASMGYLNSDLIIDYLKKADSLGNELKIKQRDFYLINLKLGNVYEEINNNYLALSYYKKALLISEKRKDSNAISLLYNNIGYLYLQDSIYDKSIAYLDKGYKYANNKNRKASLSINKADYYFRQSNYKEAITNYNRAINLLATENDSEVNSVINIDAIKNSSNKLKLLDYLTQRGSFWYKWYLKDNKQDCLESSLSDFKLADQLIDEITLNAGEQLSKLFWREKGANLYIKAIEVCKELNQPELAYYFLEKNKALLLLEHLNNQQAKLLSNLPDNLVAKDYSFRQQIVNTSNQDQLFELKNNYQRFKDSLVVAYPTYAELQRKLPILNLEEHKKEFVNTNQATLQYIVNGTKAFGLLASVDKTLLFKIDNVEEFNANVSTLRALLQKPFTTKEELTGFKELSRSLFNKVLPQEVFNLIKGKKLLISPDGNLQNIPFEAFVVNNTNKPTYLLESNETSYVYSFSYTKSNKELERNPEHMFLGMAPKIFKNKDLAPLLNSTTEIESINTIYRDNILLETNANKEAFLTNFGKYKLVHLATHSGLDEDEKPWLAFYDTKIKLNEIYATKNEADLVVLSACKTSQGSIQNGEGVMSMARGFFFSGTETVVSTLWNINDKTTESIMVDFYKNLDEGLSKSKALHKAKLAYLQNNSGSLQSPFYWSSFILIGDGEGVVVNASDLSTDLILKSIALLVFIVFLTFLFKRIFFHKKRKHN